MDATNDIDRLAGVLPLGSIIPFPDLLLGGALLVAVVLIHGVGIRLVSGHFRKRSNLVARRAHASLRLDALLGVVIFLLLALHLAEVVFWTAALVYSRLVTDWRTAAFFAANTYTTVGYGKFVLPQEWNMMSPIISISGLFTFGWTGSVLVGFVTSLNQLSDRSSSNSGDEANPRS
ncbi:MAG TPA: ion channel [Casimicrobiaceae bacterium]|nr:ion channel [Casimicrobiaceae bacterium]